MLFNFEGAASRRKGQRSSLKEKREEEELRQKGSWKRGGVAQLGEHLPCKQGVMGSNPIISTKSVERTKKKKAEENGSGREAYGLIAQVVRARA